VTTTPPSTLIAPTSRAAEPPEAAHRGMVLGFQMRVVAALLVTALLPLLTAIALANNFIQRVSSTAFQTEFGEQLDRSLDVYSELIKSMKSSMRSEGEAIAARESLRSAAAGADKVAVDRELAAAIVAHPTLLSVAIEASSGVEVAAARRPQPVDERLERPFTVREPLGDGAGDPTLVAVFAADRTRLDQMEAAYQFAQAWKVFAEDYRGQWHDRPYFIIFAGLFGLTVLLAVIVGILVVRPAIQRINRLAAATKPVADGDLTVRVVDDGKDEIAQLAVAFNRMLEQLGRSRARIDFLKRVGEWKQMARRLAHEIKNPLTPIQLAVQECHQRYAGDDPVYRALLDTTRDIVVEEVEGLRRLVGEFAAFARLPRAALREGDLGEFLREQKPRLLREEVADDEAVELVIEIEEGELPIAIDRTMLYRVLSNLVANAIQAAKADHGSAKVHIRALAEQDACVLEVEDDGPGIDPTVGVTIFDPYVTTKQDGTGLGLTIVKKIVIDHGGQIDVDTGALGGACFRVRLPVLGTEASYAAMAQSETAPFSA
jgi:two-component system nitrogen regulation sensor histidine kinase NtrY